MTASVTKLEPPVVDASKPATVPAIEISTAVNITERHQVMIRMPVVSAELSEDEANRHLDRIVDMAQRQIARLELYDHEQALADKKAALALQLDRKAKAQQEYEAQGAGFETEIERLRKKHDAALEEAAQAHYNSGRQGEFKAAGALRAQLRAYERAVEIEAEKSVKHRDSEQHAQLVEKPHAEIITKLEQEIAAIERVIGRHKAALGIKADAVA